MVRPRVSSDQRGNERVGKVCSITHLRVRSFPSNATMGSAKGMKGNAKDIRVPAYGEKLAYNEYNEVGDRRTGNLSM